ncbi:hypothetical protein ACFFOV_14595 [Cerasicoccus arenae]|nr:hypothetical protein [Cerasicoccus arenae]
MHDGIGINFFTGFFGFGALVALYLIALCLNKVKKAGPIDVKRDILALFGQIMRCWRHWRIVLISILSTVRIDHLVYISIPLLSLPEKQAKFFKKIACIEVGEA